MTCSGTTVAECLYRLGRVTDSHLKCFSTVNRAVHVEETENIQDSAGRGSLLVVFSGSQLSGTVWRDRIMSDSQPGVDVPTEFG